MCCFCWSTVTCKFDLEKQQLYILVMKAVLYNFHQWLLWAAWSVLDVRSTHQSAPQWHPTIIFVTLVATTSWQHWRKVRGAPPEQSLSWGSAPDVSWLVPPHRRCICLCFPSWPPGGRGGPKYPPQAHHGQTPYWVKLSAHRIHSHAPNWSEMQNACILFHGFHFTTHGLYLVTHFLFHLSSLQ